MNLRAALISVVAAFLIAGCGPTIETPPVATEEPIETTGSPEEPSKPPDDTPDGETAPDGSAGPLALFPGVKVDIERREVYLDATVCLETGILEFLVCRPGEFDYESAFTSTARPSHLHAALLMLGMTPTRGVPRELRALAAKSRGVEFVDASALAIDVLLTDIDGVVRRYPVEELLVNRAADDGEVPAKWEFSGSVFVQREEEEVYGADLSGVHVAIWPKCIPVVQFTADIGNPYQGEDLGIEINEETIPKRGAKVSLIFRLADESETMEP